MVKTFETPQDKAQYYIDHFATIVHNAVKRDINKVAKATGNKESSEALKLSAQAALWITVCENPEESTDKTIKMAKSLFTSWVKDEYAEEILRNRSRKCSTDSYTTTPWGSKIELNNDYIDPKESPDRLVERELELKHLIKIADQLILKWGPHATTWALANFKTNGVLATARNLGFTDKEIYDKKTITWQFRKLYKLLNDIQLEIEQLER